MSHHSSFELSMMQLALERAQEAFAQGEVPVGAVLTLNGEVVATGHNRVEVRRDPTAHAEMEVLREASRELGNWRLIGAHLFTTLEPCAMCLGAIINSRCALVTWGAPDLRQGADGSWCHLLATPHPIFNPQLRGGCLAAESAQLMQSFFRDRRRRTNPI